MKVNYFLATLAAVAALAGCSDTDSGFTQEQLIISRWKLDGWYNDTAIDIDNDGTASTDLYSQWNNCSKYTSINFSDNHRVELIYNGYNKDAACPPGLIDHSNESPLPWQIVEADVANPHKELVIDTNGITQSYEIVELSSTTLVLKGAGLIVTPDESNAHYNNGYLKFIRIPK